MDSRLNRMLATAGGMGGGAAPGSVSSPHETLNTQRSGYDYINESRHI
jgi:hypothetical protein